MNKAEKEVVKAQLKNEADCLDSLKETYRDAIADIDERIAVLLGRDDANAQNVIYQVQYQEALKKQISASLDSLQAQEFETISDYLTTSYEEGFLGSLYDMQKQGIPLIYPMDQAQIVQAITQDTKLSTDLYTALGKDVAGLKKTISAEISRGIATGMTYGQIAGNVERYANIGRNNALRIARTEGHRISSKASYDACEKAQSKGADVVKQWDATLDSKTRESHRQCDGEVRELNEPFSNGLMYPSDPSGDAEETINCRCVLIQQARWNLDAEFTKAVVTDDGTQIVSFKDAKDYADFKKSYWDLMDKLKGHTEGDIATKCSKEFYEGMRQSIIGCKNEDAVSVWESFEERIKVESTGYTGTAHHYNGAISFNEATDKVGNSYEKPYNVVFHESGHAIDYYAGHDGFGSGYGGYYSIRYEGGKFAETIRSEVSSYVSTIDKQLKEEFKEHKSDIEWLYKKGFVTKWDYDYYKSTGKFWSGDPKYSKSKAYSIVEKELMQIPSIARSDLSDMFEGATKGKIYAGFGHGASYWSGSNDSLSKEAFAEMYSALLTCPESLEQIQKYLPKSYGVFTEMLEALAKGDKGARTVIRI